MPESALLGTHPGTLGGPAIYHLLCIFNGFALGQPLCRDNKVNLTRGWVYDLLAIRPAGHRAPGRFRLVVGDVAADGVD